MKVVLVRIIPRFFLLLAVFWQNLAFCGDEDDQKDEYKERLNHRATRAQELIDIEAKYTSVYPNLAEPIRQIISNVRSFEFYPERHQNTPVTPIWLIGPPGIGKSTVIEQLVTDLGLGPRFRRRDFKTGDSDLSTAPLVELTSMYQGQPGVTGIYLADEVGKLKGVDDEKFKTELQKHLEQLGQEGQDRKSGAQFFCRG